MDISNKLITKLKSPFWDIFHNDLLLDNRGRIQKILRESTSISFAPTIELLKEHQSVFDLFDFKNFKRLNDALKLQKGFFIRPNIPSLAFALDFFTDIPFMSIEIHKIDAHLFLGIVKLIEFLPNIPTTRTNLILYLDANDRIRGLNGNFYEQFSSRFSDPNALLGQTVPQFLEPTPKVVNDKNAEEMGKIAPAVWGNVLTQNDLIPANLKSQKGKTIKIAQDRILWQNHTLFNDYFPISFSINTTKEEVVVKNIPEW